MTTDHATLYSVGDAARRAGLGPDRIRQAVRLGELPAQRTVGGQYIIAACDLDAWQARRNGSNPGADDLREVRS